MKKRINVVEWRNDHNTVFRSFIDTIDRREGEMHGSMCTDRIACSRRRFDRRRCRGATCSQGLTGLRGPVAMGSRDTKHGSGFEFFLSQYRSSPSTSYSSAPCNYTRCYAIPTFKLLYFRLCILAIIGTFF